VNSRVLIIDDDTSMRDVLQESLSRLGFDVVTAGSAGEAIDTLHSGEFETALDLFAQTYEQRYVLESMAVLDAMVGLALSQQLLQLNDEAMETAGRLAEFAQALNEGTIDDLILKLQKSEKT